VDIEFSHAALEAALTPPHILTLESDCEQKVRICDAARRIADAYSLPIRRARLLVQYSSVRVRP
jgi:hypothetical protein